MSALLTPLALLALTADPLTPGETAAPVTCRRPRPTPESPAPQAGHLDESHP
jgi:hypothetical protein